MNPPSRAKVITLWVCAGLATALLIGSYAVALLDGSWPRGHPWHGIALLALAGFFLVQIRLHRGGMATRVVAMALPLIAVAAMMVATMRLAT